eukprot:PLAT11309.1.p2 GENE.PLAT11309.1~~PLAT11309.1.p2  ORF type:complete len:1120 (+),score=597.79 PLAT11309.1:36-3395(+)
MAPRAIREYAGKKMLSEHLGEMSHGEHSLESRVAQVRQEEFDAEHASAWFAELGREHPWLLTERLVVKPDQLLKRRGKGGLLCLDASWEEAQEWITQRMGLQISVGPVKGVLTTFLIEPFVPHAADDEYYVCIQSLRDGEVIMFHHQGGVDVGDVDAKALRLHVPLGEHPRDSEVEDALLQEVPEERRRGLASFLNALFKLFMELNFVYMEINPLVVVGDSIVPLDLAAKLDETADFEVGEAWGKMDFPPPFGRTELPEEAYIRDLDSKTGASLKLTILNPKGRIWTLVAGGGASVVYADTISDYGFGSELANYGEYSGAPSSAMTYEYARTLLSLMLAEKDPRGKVLIIGGGIANFTDVATTFEGVMHALEDFQMELIDHNVKIWVRRGGPNYQQALAKMRALGEKLGVPIKVFGPDTHITAIVVKALNIVPVGAVDTPALGALRDKLAGLAEAAGGSAAAAFDAEAAAAAALDEESKGSDAAAAAAAADAGDAGDADGEDASLPAAARHAFSAGTKSIVWGMQTRAVQGMIDFDHLCKREQPSVSAMVFPFSGNHFQKFYWGTEEILVPVYQYLEEAIRKHPEVSVMINFASFRSAYQSTMQTLKYSDQIKTIAIIAEGIPETRSRLIIKQARKKGVMIIGPATVGGIKPGAFRIGNTGGMLDNIVASKLYRPGSVGYVSKSGGMSNELNNIIAHNTDGVFEGIAIGGDRYPGTRFIDHLLRYQDDPACKMLVLLGEVGGSDEYDVCDALASGRITKPLVAWCIGTCAKVFPFEVQFGHAGALARGKGETADAKNAALAAAGAIVPRNFDEFAACIKAAFDALLEHGIVTPMDEPEKPVVPMEYDWAKKLGLIRKPSSFISTISDERGEELCYAGMPISQVLRDDIGVGGVVSLLWFRQLLPIYATKFIEMVLMVTADHGPAVSGAHNTIVSARAGKDLVSSLASGLLTIGPRFGGALDGAAHIFSWALDQGMSPKEFVAYMRKKNELIMGIGHRIRSVHNPDKRVSIVAEYARKHFPRTDVLDYAFEVERITTQKKSNLILNVDGAIACGFVDLLRGCGSFTKEEAGEMIKNGVLNGLFVLGRTIGFTGHFLDQRRLRQGLYRHPWDDISYIHHTV